MLDDFKKNKLSKTDDVQNLFLTIRILFVLFSSVESYKTDAKRLKVENLSFFF